MNSHRKLAFLFAILAATLLKQAASEETEAEAEPAAFRCLGICGNDEGELEDPDLVVYYQWNLRVPVCAGVSCDNDSCANLEEKLGLIEIDEFTCTKHRVQLQDTAGCTCSDPGTRPPKLEEVLEGPRGQGEEAGGYKSKFNWLIFGIVWASLCWY